MIAIIFLKFASKDSLRLIKESHKLTPLKIMEKSNKLYLKMKIMKSIL
jgi:hypothetical protein